MDPYYHSLLKFDKEYYNFVKYNVTNTYNNILIVIIWIHIQKHSSNFEIEFL